MRGRPSPIDALVTLPQLKDASERRARWRAAIASLGQRSAVDGPPPLDGVDIELLKASCRLALETGLADDLDWIAGGAAGTALYELTTTLPQGAERREFGRRVLTRLYGGPAGAFVTVASRMAWGAAKQLEAPGLRARVRLCFSLPIGTSINHGPLALALVSRREHFERWILRAATGPLHTRRLAAVILQAAAGEAVRRAASGDRFPTELLTGSQVRPIHERLMADREPLVWHHAAVARGLLAGAEPQLREEIDLLLDPSLGPTEWRRAVVSLVACLSHDQDQAMPQCLSLIRGDLVKKHPPLLSTFLWGLPPVIESEPEAAECLLSELVKIPRLDVATAVATLLRDVRSPSFAQGIANQVRPLLQRLSVEDSTLPTYLDHLHRGLEAAESESVYHCVRRALVAYETSGATAAQALAAEALQRSHQVMSQVESATNSVDEALPLLVDLDASSLESSRLYDLLLLSRAPGELDATAPQLELLFERLGHWILGSESRNTDPAVPSQRVLASRRQQLVTLLHVVDVQTTDTNQHEALGLRVRGRIQSAIEVLLRNLAQGPPAALHRVICAAAARSFDAAVREGVAEISDLLLLVITQLQDQDDVRAIMDASTDPDMHAALQSYSEFLTQVTSYKFPSPDASDNRVPAAYLQFSRGLGRRGAYRGEALRRACLGIGRALESLVAARGLQDLLTDEPGGRNPVEELEHQTETVQSLARGAARRALSGFPPSPSEYPAPGGNRVSELVEQCVRQGLSLDGQELQQATLALTEGLAPPFRDSIQLVVQALGSLPVVPPANVSIIPLKPRSRALPDWLLPRRTIGGFYVIRAIGTGGVSSVFLARRVEERRDEEADNYALKIPQYDPTTARSLSEHEFLEMFRDEAGALLALPPHPNLARFVNFDLAAKPKPILVMELIRGHTLEKLIRSRSLTLDKALTYLVGILNGLAAMHSADVAHLDVKPSNVVLRDETPVLVDFGLSGRQLRAGCGTPEYCAPEVLGVVPEGLTPEARPADMYAFACTAIEVLTGQLLFDADEETALMTQHVSHDGWPDALAEFSEGPGLKTLAVLLAACLRRDPRNRPGPADMARELRKCAADLPLQSISWPLPLHGHQAEISA